MSNFTQTLCSIGVKDLYILILFLSVSASAQAQIWDYPPEPVSNWMENSTIPKDSLKQLTVWNHKIVDGKDSGEKELKLTQEFDSEGNTTRIIYGHGDTVLFDNYINGFWQIKIANGTTYQQSVEFDSSGNVINLSINDFAHSVYYDSLNRPIRSVNESEERLWKYNGDDLIDYSVSKNGVLSEQRTYYYDSTKNTISYSSQFFGSNGQRYPNPDSVSAYFNDNEEIYKIVSYSHYTNGWDTLTMNINLTEDYMTSVSSSVGCQKTQRFSNEKGLLKSVNVSNCEGVIFRKTSYEYVFVKN